MLGILAILTMVGVIVGAIYYLIGAVLVVVGANLGGGRVWVQLGAWITAVPVLVLLAVVLLVSGGAR